MRRQMTDRWHSKRRQGRGRGQEHRSQERSVQGILQWSPSLVSQPHAPKLTSIQCEVESLFYLEGSPVCRNHISEHKMPFTSQQLKLRGVNVFLGTEPKSTYNYWLKDSINLGHATLNLQQNSCWCQYNLCANCTTVTCVHWRKWVRWHIYHLISSSDIPLSLQNQQYFSIFPKLFSPQV